MKTLPIIVTTGGVLALVYTAFNRQTPLEAYLLSLLMVVAGIGMLARSARGSSGPADAVSLIERLQGLLEKGALTREEFERQKAAMFEAQDAQSSAVPAADVQSEAEAQEPPSNASSDRTSPEPNHSPVASPPDPTATKDAAGPKRGLSLPALIFFLRLFIVAGIGAGIYFAFFATKQDAAPPAPAPASEGPVLQLAEGVGVTPSRGERTTAAPARVSVSPPSAPAAEPRSAPPACAAARSTLERMMASSDPATLSSLRETIPDACAEEARLAETRIRSIAATEQVPAINQRELNWLTRPTASELESAYPAAAFERRIEGRVRLNCVIAGDGSLTCSVGAEEPAGFGFGAAALQLSRSFRAAPLTNTGAASAGRRVRLPIQFSPPSDGAATQ
jgi:protein TonB